jgi:hypothetical protein
VCHRQCRGDLCDDAEDGGRPAGRGAPILGSARRVEDTSESGSASRSTRRTRRDAASVSNGLAAEERASLHGYHRPARLSQLRFQRPCNYMTTRNATRHVGSLVVTVGRTRRRARYAVCGCLLHGESGRQPSCAGDSSSILRAARSEYGHGHRHRSATSVDPSPPAMR